MTQPKSTWLIGSGGDCDIRVASPYVSGRHCRLAHDGSTWTIEDLGSTNGTYVNGARLPGVAKVSPNDQVTLGLSTVFPWPALGDQAADSAVISLPEPRRAVVIGRSPACDFVLSMPMVSSRHALIEPIGDGWQIRDLGSSNGTFVEGRRIDGPTRVGSGNLIGLGSLRLRLAADGGSLVERVSSSQTRLESKDIGVSVAGRQLIGGVSFAVGGGELVAIMGSSGAGKSTLLASLVGARQPDEGMVLLEGEDLYSHGDEFRGQIGYVPQDDIMHPELTVWQAVWFAARLRLPRDYSNAEIERRVTTVIDQLGLTDCAHIRIGSPERRGISGGQRKRVNVAMELITDPPTLVLDEPTSGLSSVDAIALLTLLRSLAATGKAILLTIHQPGVESLRLIDALAIIARDASTGDVGRLVWYGPAVPDTVRFFAPHGRPDDADAILRGLGTRPAVDWERDYKRSDIFRDWVKRRQSLDPSTRPPAHGGGISLPDVVSQWWALVRRALIIKKSDLSTTAILLLQAPVIALLVVGVFGSRATTELSLNSWPQTAQAVATTTFLMALAGIWFGCSNAAREIVAERAIFRRERMVGLSLMAYASSKLAVLAAMCVLQCGLLFLIVGQGCQLEAAVGSTLITLFLAANVAVVVGLCLSALARTAEAAASMLPLVILPMVILGGILLPIADLPGPANLLADTMPSRWAFESLLVSEAEARPTIELPPASAAPAASGPRAEDLAEAWFPVAKERSSGGVPNLILAGLWAIGVLALAWLLRRDVMKSRR